jgi:iron complex transport system substrate-binding protein
LIVVAGIVIAATVALRLMAQPPERLDLTRQAKAPPRAMPGAGSEPVAVVGRKNGRRLIAHVGGVSSVPDRPQRIVALEWADELLAIGVMPVAASADGQNRFPGYLRSRLQGAVELVTNAGAPDLETLAALKPDLIVMGWFQLALWPQLERIAPTVVLQPSHWTWRERFRDLALVSGRETEGEAALAHVEGRLEAAKHRIEAAAPGQSVALLRIFAREFRLYGYGYSGPLLYGDLALPPPKLVKQLAWDQDPVRLSLEGLSLLDADVILLMTDDGDRIPVSYQVADRLLNHPLWNSLKAVRHQRVFGVPNRMMRGGALARAEMGELVAQLMEGRSAS